MKNQTDERWLKKVSATDKGIGLHVFRTNYVFNWPWNNQDLIISIGKDYLSKIIKDNLTYKECVDLAEKEAEVMAFKWIPTKIASFSKVEKSSSNFRAKILCVNRCASYGCICILGECL